MEEKRLHIGGLHPEVTESELHERFSKFGTINGVQIKVRKGVEDSPSKAFAYLNITAPDGEIKKCMKVFDKTKWKGFELKIQLAKENFLSRLAKERSLPGESEGNLNLAEETPPPKKVFEMEVKGPPGTRVPGEEDWVVGKYGRILPVVNLKKEGTRYPKKIDPSKYVHKVKKLDDDNMVVNQDKLTWQMDDPNKEITKKRKGEFKDWKPKPKQRKHELDYTLEDVLKKTSAKYIFAEENFGEGGQMDFEIVDTDKSSFDTKNKEFEYVDLSRFASDSDTDNDDRKEKLLSSGNKAYQQSVKNKTGREKALGKKPKVVLLKEFKGTRSITASNAPVVTSSKKSLETKIDKSVDSKKATPKNKNKVKTSDINSNTVQSADLNSRKSVKKSLVSTMNERAPVQTKTGVDVGQYNALSEFASGVSLAFNMKKSPASKNYEDYSSFSEDDDDDDELVREEIKPNVYDPLSIFKSRTNKTQNGVTQGQTINDSSSSKDPDRPGQSTVDKTKVRDKANANDSSTSSSSSSSDDDEITVKSNVLVKSKQIKKVVEENKSSESEDVDDENKGRKVLKTSVKDMSRKVVESQSSDSSSDESDSNDDDEKVKVVKSAVKDKPSIQSKIVQSDSSTDDDDDDDDDDSENDEIAGENKAIIHNKPSIKQKNAESKSSESDEEDDVKIDVRSKSVTKDTDVDKDSSDSDSEDDTVVTKAEVNKKASDNDSSSSDSSSSDDEDVSASKNVGTPSNKPTSSTNQSSDSDSESSSENDDDSNVKKAISTSSKIKTRDSGSSESESSDSSGGEHEKPLLPSTTKHTNVTLDTKKKMKQTINNDTNKPTTKSNEDLSEGKVEVAVRAPLKPEDSSKGNVEVVVRAPLKPEDVERQRLETVKQKHQDNLKQAAAVKKALLDINKGSTLNKKVVFDDSDDDGDDDGNDDDDDDGNDDDDEDNGLKPQKEKSTVVEKKPALFDSSSSDDDSSDDSGDSDEERFAIRPHFEGSSGSKLLELQATYGNDERFQLDKRFADDGDSDADDDNDKEAESIDHDEEKQNAMKILESVVGFKITKDLLEKKKAKNTFKDMANLQYDPTSEGHTELELAKEQVSKKKKKSKKELEEEKALKSQEEGEQSVEKMQERFIEVSDSFKDAFTNKDTSDGGQTFSLLQAFGVQGQDDPGETEAYNGESMLHTDKDKLPLDARFLESEDKHDDMETEPMDTSQRDVGVSDTITDPPSKDKKKSKKMKKEYDSFFFKEEDDRLKAGTSFFRTENIDEVREKWRKQKAEHIQRFKSTARNFNRKMNRQSGQTGQGSQTGVNRQGGQAGFNRQGDTPKGDMRWGERPQGHMRHGDRSQGDMRQGDRNDSSRGRPGGGQRKEFYQNKRARHV